MQVAVLLAGVADPKRPLARPSTGRWADVLDCPTTPFKLSPFDEAALEIALKLRDRDPAVRITALVTDGATDSALLRAVAAFRPDRVAGLLAAPGERGDPARLAKRAGTLLRAPGKPADMILIGREHGDLDDGMTPAYLAEAWQLPFVGLALLVSRADDGELEIERAAAGHNESLHLTGPLLVSVSNDKRNRLRHPLMKNVMLAKQQQFDLYDPNDMQGGIGSPGTLREAAPADTAARGMAACRMLDGPPEAQAHTLAHYLQTCLAAPENHVHT